MPDEQEVLTEPKDILSIPIDYIDGINNISDKIIERCQSVYEKHGKDKAYKTLNDQLYNNTPNLSQRYLYLYRTAMGLTKNVYITDNYNKLIDLPLWKRKKWSYIKKDVIVKTDATIFEDRKGNIIYNNFTLDDYSDPQYNNIYNSKESNMTMKSRAGTAVIRVNRFDFEYKYSDNEYYYKLYLKYIYNTFRRIFFITSKYAEFDTLLSEEIESLNSILGELPDDIKIDIINVVSKFILYEKDTDSKTNLNHASREYYDYINKLSGIIRVITNEEGDYVISTEVEKDNSVDEITQKEELRELKNKFDYEYENNFNNMYTYFGYGLSKIHSQLLLPFEFISYLICALLHPRFEAIIEDSKGNIGTHIFGENRDIFPSITSSTGPSKISENETNTLSVFIPKINIYQNENGISLYENLFITGDNEYNFSCFSYNKNKWLADIPLVNPSSIPIEKDIERKLIKMIPIEDTNGNTLLLVIYSDCIMSYNVNTHEWIEDNDSPYHLFQYDLKSLFPDNECINAFYDKELSYIEDTEETIILKSLLIFIDIEGNIASYNFLNGISTLYDGTISSGEEISPTIHFDFAENGTEKGIVPIKDLIFLKNVNTNNEYKFLCHNNERFQIVTYSNTNSFKVEIDYSDHCDGFPIVGMIKIDDYNLYIVFNNHKIIKLSTYMHTPTVFQEGKDTCISVILNAVESYCDSEKTIIYISDDYENNTKPDLKLNLIHPVSNRVSELSLPLIKYIGEESSFSRYNEYFIQASNISIFSHSYYALSGFLRSSNKQLSRRV